MIYLQQIPEKIRELDRLSQEFLTPRMVKEALEISLAKSQFILELAARYGLFKKQYVVRCKDCEVILEWYDYKDQIESHVPCHADDSHAGFNGEQALIEKVYIREDEHE